MRRSGGSKTAFILSLLLLTIGALLFRLPALDNRPFHGDEAVHAFKFLDLWKKGVYRYDSNEYHGPTLYYAALPSVALHGRRDFTATRESDYRLPIVVSGAVLVLLFGLLTDALNRRAVLWAGLLTALSPAFVFYSRYYIQEMLLVGSTLGLLACCWRATRDKRLGWPLGAGICAGLMIASKETAVLTFTAGGISLWLTQVWTRRVDKEDLNLRRLWNGKRAALVVSVTLLTACVFLTGFGSNFAAPLDYLRSYTPWLHRAEGFSIHKHPFFYYLHLLLWTHESKGPVWSEALIVGLGMVGMVVALLPRATSRLEGSVPFARFVAFATLLLIGIYSAIPYKTPWCVLSLLSGLIVLAGIGADWLVGRAPGMVGKAGVLLLLLASCAQLGWQAYYTSYVYYADGRNPYVYAQTVPDAAKLGRRIEELTQPYSQHDQTVIQVISVDNYYWPLPWYLRRFSNIGYYTQVPPDATAPIILAAPQFDEELTKKLDATHLMTGFYSIRSGVFFEVWARMDLWKDYLAHKKAMHKDEE